MSREHGMLAVIPARGGSAGLPGKNIRPFAGLPLIAHTILYARMCPEIDEAVVSTDSQDIATVAREHGASIPFIRPPELARHDTPVWPVLRHALDAVEQQGQRKFEFLLLLDPTSPAREPADVSGALKRLQEMPSADGVIGVSKPDFNPIWHCVVEREGWMTDLMDNGGRFERRQDVPAVYRINGSLYLWRTRFVRSQTEGWRRHGRHVLYEIPELRAMSIDDLQEFQKAELLVTQGLIHFPWLKGQALKRCAR
jgi:N-acylneuraminate cytidylyltransferase